MSRTQQNEIKENPTTKYLEWKNLKEIITVDGEEIEKSKGGAFCWYNKETKEDIPLKLPLKFAIINPDMVTFKGYDEKNKTGYYANEVNGDRRKGDPLVTIKSKDGIKFEFKLSEYRLNSAALAGSGIKYVKSIYAAIEVDGKWELVNFQLKGAAFSGAPEDKNNITAEEKKRRLDEFR